MPSYKEATTSWVPFVLPRDSNQHVAGGPSALRVYLVEDSPIIVNLLRDLLGGEPNVEIIGQTGEAPVAIAEIAARAPHVVIVDIALDHGNGFDVVKAMAARGAGRPLVAMLTNYSTARYRDEARRLGADLFFDKNGGILDLVRAVAALAASADRDDARSPARA